MHIHGFLRVSPSEGLCSPCPGIPAVEQRLIFAGRQLEDELSLADYSIERGAELDGLRAPGGMPDTQA